ncbi:Ribonuclease III [invertebrate metagenome]|uniref:ribonuclease III n=1 Tax=invertebrate metagenome TaxID=1711999 RepID=A0A484H4G9_9ZZZZ
MSNTRIVCQNNIFSGVNLEILQHVLGYNFGDGLTYLQEALTHPSAARGKATAYERLEFLGDRVLSLVVANMLLMRFPTEKEGALAQRHTALVRRDALARVAWQINLGPHLLMSRGEEDSGGRDNPAILADACEGVIGALFMNAGFCVARDFVWRWWSPLMEESDIPPKDAKTALQEWAQGQGRPLPTYEVLSTAGPAHEPTFSVVVKVEGTGPAVATGSSKRLAEQTAAQAILERIGWKHAE